MIRIMFINGGNKMSKGNPWKHQISFDENGELTTKKKKKVKLSPEILCPKCGEWVETERIYCGSCGLETTQIFSVMAIDEDFFKEA